LDSPQRGIGQHCLKYNYSIAYHTYQIVSQRSISSVIVTVINGNTTDNITLTNLSPEYISPNIETTMFGATSFYLDTSLNIAVAQNNYINSTLPTSITSWFFLLPNNAIGITGSSWRWLAKCSNNLHDLTQTDASNPTDQFGIFQNQYNLKQIVPNIIAISPSIISQQTVNLMLINENQQSNTIRLRINKVE